MAASRTTQCSCIVLSTGRILPTCSSLLAGRGLLMRRIRTWRCTSRRPGKKDAASGGEGGGSTHRALLAMSRIQGRLFLAHPANATGEGLRTTGKPSQGCVVPAGPGLARHRRQGTPASQGHERRRQGAVPPKAGRSPHPKRSRSAHRELCSNARISTGMAPARKINR